MLGRLVVRRLLQLVPVLFGVTVTVFLVINLLPGNAAYVILGANTNHRALVQLEEQLGLNHPLVVQYGDWIGRAIQGNLGRSLIDGQSVASALVQRLPVTLELVVLSFLIALLLAIPLAVLAANAPGGVMDRGSAFLAMIGLSVPNFVVAIVLILLLSVTFRLLPSTGYVSISGSLWGNLQSMIMPALAVGYAMFAIFTRMLRADMTEQIATQDYVVAARANGLNRRSILLNHVLRNSLVPLVTAVGVNFGTLFGATVIVESIFALPGVGQLLITSIVDRNVPMVEGIVLCMAVVVVVVNLLADIAVAVLDPRVRHGHASR